MDRESTLYKVVLLGVLCAVCGFLLSAVNTITAPIIEVAAREKEAANLELIYPGSSFTEITDYQDDTGLIQAVYDAEGKGKVFKIKTVGYNSNGFTFLVAINNDGIIGGYRALEQQETSGYGARAFEEQYTSEIEGLPLSSKVPLLSGATITTTAVRKGIEAARAVFASIGQ